MKLKCSGQHMAIVAILTASLLFTMLQSCNKDSGKSYTLALNTGSVNVVILPTAAATILDTFGSGVTNFNIDSFIKAGTGNNSLALSNISSVKLASCVLTITSGASSPPSPYNSFGNFGVCTAAFSSNTNTNAYEIGVTHNSSGYTTTLTMATDSTTEFKSYFTGSQFKYALIGTLGNATTDTMVCNIQFLYTMYIQG